VSKNDVLSTPQTLAIVIPAAFLDTLFYYWIVFSLIRTMQQLTLRRQMLKLNMYKKFWAVLVIVGVVEVVFMAYRAYRRLANKPIGWQYNWILDTYGEVLYFIVIAAIAFLWRPRQNNMRYGYAEFFEEDDNPNPTPDTDIELKTIKVSNLTSFDKKILEFEFPDEGNNVNLDTEIKKMD